MATIYKRALSNSVNGRMIKITTNASPGDLIHTAVAGVVAQDNFDEIWLWAMNSEATARKLTMEFGGVLAPDDQIEQTVPPESGLMLILPGLILQNGLLLRAFSAAVNTTIVGGWVNRIAA